MLPSPAFPAGFLSQQPDGRPMHSTALTRTLGPPARPRTPPHGGLIPPLASSRLASGKSSPCPPCPAATAACGRTGTTWSTTTRTRKLQRPLTGLLPDRDTPPVRHQGRLRPQANEHR